MLLGLHTGTADYAPPPQRLPSVRQPGRPGAPGSTGVASRAAGAAVNAAGTALQGAGAKMFPILAQLYSRAAGSLIGELACCTLVIEASHLQTPCGHWSIPILAVPMSTHRRCGRSRFLPTSPSYSAPPTAAADDPVTLGLLREAQQQSDLLRDRLLEAEHRAVALLHDNIVLKQQLGLPVEAEQAALAAWVGAPPPPQGQLPELPAAAGEESVSGGGGTGAGQGAEPASPGAQGSQEEQGQQRAVEGEDQVGAAPATNATPEAAGGSDGPRAGARRRRSGRA